MGTSVILLEKGRLRKTGKAKCLVSQKISDFEDKYVILEPLDNNGVPMYVWNRLQNGMCLVEGEGYIVDGCKLEEALKKHKYAVQTKWRYKSLKWFRNEKLIH